MPKTPDNTLAELKQLLGNQDAIEVPVDQLLDVVKENPGLAPLILELFKQTKKEGEVGVLQLPESDPRLFVGREKLIKQVRQAVLEAVETGIVNQKVLYFSGEMGVGKTEFMLHLHRHVFPKIPGVLTFYIHLGPSDRKLNAANMEFDVQTLDHKGFLQLLKLFSAKVDVFVPQETSIQEQSGWLVNKLGSFTKMQPRDEQNGFTREQIVVLLVDGLSTEVPHEFVDLLENYLLSPLFSSSTTMLALAGRKKPNFLNYLLSKEIQETHLHPFGKEGLRTLLTFLQSQKSTKLKKVGERGLQKLDQIYQASGGYPGVAVDIAKGGHLRDGIESVISKILSSAPNKETARQHLEALALLNRWSPELSDDTEWGMRDSDALLLLNAYFFFNQEPDIKAEQAFDEDMLKKLFQWFRNNRQKHKSRSYLRQVRSEMGKLQLLRWKAKSSQVRGWFIREPIRFPIAYSMRLNKPALWQWLHYVAWRMFSDWAEKYSKEKYAAIAKAHEQAWREMLPQTPEE